MPDLSAEEISSFNNLLTTLSPNLALALSEQINRDLLLEAPILDAVPIQDLLISSDQVVQTTFSLSHPMPAESVFLFTEAAGMLFVNLMEGGDGSDPPIMLTDAQNAKLANAMAGLARGLAMALTNMGIADLVEVESSITTIGVVALPPVFALDGNAVRVRLPLEIPELFTSELSFLFTPEFARALINNEEEDSSGGSDGILGQDELEAMLGGLSGMGGGAAPTMAAESAPAPAGGGAPFASFPPAAGSGEAMPRGLELILDIPLDVTVELGRVRMLIKDVLELGSGSIVELDRVAGEPVDLLVNGRLVAKGEVVVIEDNFGIRITEIISPAERVAGLAGKGR